MSAEGQMPVDNKVIVQRFWDEIFDGGDLDVADEIFAPEWVLHDDREAGWCDLDASSGPAAVKELVNTIRNWFSNLQITDHYHFAAEADQVVTRFAISATRGDLPVDVQGMSISQVAGGKIVGSWLYWESGRMYEQLDYFKHEPGIGWCRPPWNC